MTMSLSPTRLRTLLLLSLVTSSAAAQSLISQSSELILAAGDPAPGIPGTTISATSNFDAPVVDQNGTMLFRARLVGAVTATDDRAYFYGRGKNDLQPLIRNGSQAPGLPTGILLRTSGAGGLVGSPRISPFGELFYFQSALYDPITPGNTPTTADSALFWGPAGGLTLLAREGDQVPFLATGITWGAMAMSYQNNAINGTGLTLFTTTLLGAAAGITTANDAIMVTGVPGGLNQVLREGDVLPTGEVVIGVSGNTMSFINQINEAGQVLHEIRFAVVAPSTATTANDRGLAIWTAGTDVIIAREGQQAPGLPTGVLFATPAFGWSASVGASSFTRSGNMLMISPLDGAGTTTANDNALYYGGASGWTLVMREGDLVPGLTGGEQFAFVGNVSMTCDDASNLTFIAGLTGGSVTANDDSAVMIGTPGNLQVLAREGSIAPGLAPSVNGPWRYEQITQGSQTPYLVADGTILWQCSVTDGVTSNRTVHYAYTKRHGMRVLIDPTVDTITTSLGTGAWSTVSTTGNSNSGDGGPSWINNNGDFVCRPNILGAPTAAIVRGHVGSLTANPASVPAAGLVPQNFGLDCTAANASQIYILIGSLNGTRPGTPFPPITIPLNLDGWLDISIGYANTAVYTNTLGLLDANGKASMSFTLPAGVSGAAGLTLHHSAVVLDFFTLAPVLATEPTSLKFY